MSLSPLAWNQTAFLGLSPSLTRWMAWILPWDAHVCGEIIELATNEIFRNFLLVGVFKFVRKKERVGRRRADGNRERVV